MIVPHKDNKKIFTVNKKSPIIAALVNFDVELAYEGFNVAMAEEEAKKK